MNKVIVTGGAGFIGSHLVDMLVELDYEVHVIDNLINGKSSNVNKKAVLHILDILHLEMIKPIFKNTEYVFHLAALPRVQYSIDYPIETNKTNIGGTLNILEVCRKENVKKVIYSSSSSVYGDQEVLPLKETMKVYPKSPYALQKYIGELYCQLYSSIFKTPTVVLRYFNVYGSRSDDTSDYSLVISKFLKQKALNTPMTITGNGYQSRDFTYVKDVARANILAMKSSKVRHGEVINIGFGKSCSINKIAELIGGSITYIPARLEPRHTTADRLLAKELLDWEPEISIEEGITKI